MRKLYEAADRIEAQVLKDHLQDEGVESVILGDYLSGAMGELPANIYPEVWVLDAKDMAKAQQILRDFTKSHIQREQNGDWRCLKCGEMVDAGFELCWNCATPRTKQK
ncbi:MAG: DUF2007 domain-containing protein [Pseudomonadota bacterium]